MAVASQFYQLSVRLEADLEPRHLLLIKRPVGLYVAVREAVQVLLPGVPVTTFNNYLYSERDNHPGGLLQTEGLERAMLVALAGVSKFSKHLAIASLQLLVAALRKGGRLTQTMEQDLAAPLTRGVAGLVQHSPAAVLHNQQQAVVGLLLPAAPQVAAAAAVAAAAPAAAPAMLQPIIINVAPGVRGG